MPYVKRSGYRPRSRYQRKYRRKNTSLAQKAYRLAKKAYKMPELKHNALSLTATGTAFNGGYTWALDSLSPGTTNNTRIGNVVHPTSVRIRPNWATLEPQAVSFRLIVFRWLSEQPNTGFTQATQVLQSASIVSFKSEELRYESEILYDRVFNLVDYNTGTQRYPDELKIRLKKMIGYTDGGSTTSNKGGIYLMYLNDSAVTSFNPAFETRLFFRDP